MDFLAGVLQGFGVGRQRKERKEEQEKEAKLRGQLLEIEVKKAQQAEAQKAEQQKAQESFGRSLENLMAGVVTRALPGTGVQLGDVDATRAAQPKGLVEALADPSVFMKGIQAGAISPLSAGDLIPKPTEKPSDLVLREAMLANPALRDLELNLRSAGATRIDTGDKMGKIPSGYALVAGPDGQPTLQRLGGAPPTPGQQSLDQAFGQDAAAWVMAGGFADSKKSIQQLGEAKKRLEAAAKAKDPAAQKNGEKGENLTGPGVSKIPEFAKPLFNPAAVEVRDSVEEIVQRNLRLVLGAQFTEKEGERLIARSYNENLSEAENAKRVGRLIDQISQAAQAKQEAVNYFNENGTLEGFKGKLWTMADFDPDTDDAKPSGSGKVVDWNDLED